MELIRRRAYARAGLVGNPSDGYHGKTISAIVRNFRAEVTLYEWDQVEIVASEEDHSRFRSVQELVEDVHLHGYYGGIRLVKATIKRFVEYCAVEDKKLHGRSFSVRYQSNIPRQVGLAGSSAIIVATLRCLMEFYGVDVPLEVQPSLVLSVETGELGIAAGLQDRVIQVYEGLVYMDFSPKQMVTKHGLACGVYERLEASLLPPLYLSYSTERSKPTERVHNDLRARYERGDRDVVDAMRQLADLTVLARQAILARDAPALGKLIDANFEVRRSICRLPAGQIEMIERARRTGATAGFPGSGGAIVGTCPDEATFQRLRAELEAIHCHVLRPQVLPGG
jgi:glucuronokinase